MFESFPQPEQEASNNQEHSESTYSPEELTAFREKITFRFNTIAEELGFTQTPEMQSLLNEGNTHHWSEKAAEIVDTAQKDDIERRQLFIAQFLSLAAHYSKIGDEEKYNENYFTACTIAENAQLSDVLNSIDAVFE